MPILIENLSTLQNVIYIISSMLFITGIKMLGKEDTAVRGNFLSALAMFIAVSIISKCCRSFHHYYWYFSWSNYRISNST